MKPLLEGAMELPGDKYRIRIDELERQLEAERAKTEEECERLRKENEELKRRMQELEGQISI